MKGSDPSGQLAAGVDEPWWTLSAGSGRRALVDGDGRPVPLGGGRDELVAALRERARGFTPEWTGTGPDDAGDALLRLFGLMAEAVAGRVDLLPDKLLVELLRVAGVAPLPASPARALLRLTATAAAGPGVQVPAGFQAGAPGADGVEVVLETVDDLWVSPAELAYLAVGRPATGTLPGPVDEVRPGEGASADGFPPFGERAAAGSALWLGFTAPEAPEGGLSLAFVAAPRPGGPAAVARGPVAPPDAPPPELRWSVLDGSVPRPADVVVDRTGSLAGTGTVQLRLPGGWRPGRPPGGPQLPEAHWLRVRLAAGSYAQAPRLVAVLPHTVLADAVRTVRDEVLSPAPADPADEGGGAGVRLRVASPPVVPGSLTVTVPDDPAAPLFPVADVARGAGSVWREVPDLSSAGPADRVFALDAETGVLTFGDGVHGLALPPGVGDVRAVAYRTGGGRRGAVAKETATVLRTAVPGVAAVTNPLAGTGGGDAERFEATVRRGAAEIRTAGRAVTPADHALLALRAPGARTARAHAVPGHHPDHPGARLPGIVGVYLVPPDEDPSAPGAPLPSDGDLAAVADHLTRVLAPTGITVVTAAPRYVRVDARIVLATAAGADRAAAVRRAEDGLRRFLHPLEGGTAGDGWPFGGPLTHLALVRRLLVDDAVTAVPRLTLTVDGLPSPPCADVPLPPHALVRAGRVTASVVAERGR